MEENLQIRLKERILTILGEKSGEESQTNLLALHLEEIHEETKEISLMIEEILAKKTDAERLYFLLVEMKVRGNHLKDHISEMRKLNETILTKIDKIIKKK